MSRIVDEPYFTHSAYSAFTTGIQVKCPKCHGTGVVTADDDNAYFRCLSCGHQETRDRTIYRYDVHNQCKNCGRYYRVDIEDEAKQQFPVLHVACPYCGMNDPSRNTAMMNRVKSSFRRKSGVRNAWANAPSKASSYG